MRDIILVENFNFYRRYNFNLKGTLSSIFSITLGNNKTYLYEWKPKYNAGSVLLTIEINH